MTYLNIEELKEIGLGKKILIYTTVYLVQGYNYKIDQKYKKPSRVIDKKFIRLIREYDNLLVITDFPLKIHDPACNLSIIEHI